jgi:hypothetical protein
MEGASQPRRLNATNVLVMLLAVAILLGAFLLLRSFGPSTTAFSVSELTGTPCPVAGAPACFQVSVTNVGTQPSNVRCDATAGPGNIAEFSLGGSTYSSAEPIDPDATLPLVVEVDTTAGNVRIYLPKVACSPI